MKLFVLHILFAVLLLGCSGKETATPDAHDHAGQQGSKYTCPMHPQVVQDKPGQCPVCGMDLVIIDKSSPESNDLMLTDSQLRLANITTEKIAKRPVGETIIGNARLTVNAEKSEVITSRAAGRIEKLYVRETGQSIKSGEPLYQLYSEYLLTLQQEYLLAKDQFETLGRSEPRYESFFKAAEQKLLRYGITKQQVEKLSRSKVSEPRITFLAPASGIVTDISVTEGQYVEEGGLLYKIEDISTLWMEAELFAQESRWLKKGDEVIVRISGFESSPVTAKISFISPEFRANSQIVVIRTPIDNKNLLYTPGMQAQVILTHTTHPGIAIPTDAVIRDGKGAHVYVQSDINTFQPRMVKTGMEVLDRMEITEGLKEGEIVVISGAYLLYSELIRKKGSDPMAVHNH